MNPLLMVENIYKRYDSLEVLKGVSFELQKGQTKAIIGPSGGGKSTILRVINRLIKPDQGRVLLDGVEIGGDEVPLNKIRQQMGMVFQQFNLFMHLSALDNVRLCLMKVKKMSKKDATDRAMRELERVALTDKASSYPAELSGGQQQRIGIARSLAMDPKLILFDEPTSALDPELIGEVLDIMAELAKEKTTMLVVTHEIGFARAVCDEIIFLENGTILEQGPSDFLLRTPKNERLREFLNKISELYGHENGGRD